MTEKPRFLSKTEVCKNPSTSWILQNWTKWWCCDLLWNIPSCRTNDHQNPELFFSPWWSQLHANRHMQPAVTVAARARSPVLVPRAAPSGSSFRWNPRRPGRQMPKETMLCKQCHNTPASCGERCASWGGTGRELSPDWMIRVPAFETDIEIPCHHLQCFVPNLVQATGHWHTFGGSNDWHKVLRLCNMTRLHPVKHRFLKTMTPKNEAASSWHDPCATVRSGKSFDRTIHKFLWLFQWYRWASDFHHTTEDTDPSAQESEHQCWFHGTDQKCRPMPMPQRPFQGQGGRRAKYQMKKRRLAWTDRVEGPTKQVWISTVGLQAKTLCASKPDWIPNPQNRNLSVQRGSSGRCPLAPKWEPKLASEHWQNFAANSRLLRATSSLQLHLSI